MTAILEAHDLVKRYAVGDEQVEALRGVSLAVDRGEFLAIMGASGSGKSTLLHLLGGLDKPSGGDVVIDGVDISALDDEQATLTRRDKTGFVFQFFNLIPLLTVRENVALPFLIGGGAAAEHQAWVDELLDMVGLVAKAEHAPDQLSAGEQRRVALARALATQPALLLADEPTGNLDYTTGGRFSAPLALLCPTGPDHRARDPRGARCCYADPGARGPRRADPRRDHLGRREDHDPAPLLARLATLGL